MSTVPVEREVAVAESEDGGRGRTVLAVGVAATALVAGVLIGRSTVEPERPAGLAPVEVSAVLEARVSAVNGDAGESEADIGAFYGHRAVLEEQDQHPHAVTRGRDDIASRLFNLRSFAGFAIGEQTHAIQVGPYVAEGLTWTGGEGIAVYELDAEMRVVHQWVIGGPPGGGPAR